MQCYVKLNTKVKFFRTNILKPLMDARKRIIYALDKSRKTRQALADMLKVGRGAVSDMLNKEGEFDSLKYLEATAELTGFSFHWLRTGQGPEVDSSEKSNMVNEPEPVYLNKKVEALENLVETQDKTIKLLEKTVAMLEETIKQQSKAGV
jgi:hypothetical protein